MLSKKMAKELNDQVTFELESAYIYLAMAAWAEVENLKGAGSFFRIQAKEEISHGMKFFEYLLERGAEVSLGAVAQPKCSYPNLRAALEAALKHEKFISGRCHKLMEIAQAEKDYATAAMLNWFVTEQVEEESNFETILARLAIAGDKGTALLIIDKELGKRTDD